MSTMPGGRPSTTPRSAFGKRLAEARQRAGLSQAEVGEKMGVSQRAIAHWERRHASLYPEQITALSRILKVRVDELLGISSDRRKPGPPSKLERQIEAVRKLPRAKQTFVSEMLDNVLGGPTK
ncbi:MAG: helix-turn-helix transcriptional regulator [Verrucomicrobia bacterium]|nr:helix-turn-helix transcriptional regulator [Kiritimatiellia bacterium]MCP5489460.1 helix-turn-helix transcriptional regulator [Verrucomicrobiota bacterium]